MNTDAIIEAAREVHEADHQVTESLRNGSLHDVAEARFRLRNGMSSLHDAFGEGK